MNVNNRKILQNKMEDAVNFLYDIPKFTTKNSPGHTKEFLALLGNPQDSFAVIHVAGSNGKGSVCKFFNEMMLMTGRRIGLFTSPHLVDIRERFLIDGQMCSVEAFLDAYMQVKSAAEQQERNSGSYPTFFEFIFAMGMVLFREAGVEYGILETGLGGRLDATNSVTAPLLTVITSISLEHTEYLGDTIEQIAGEKAGIIKPGVPVVFDAGVADASKVIRARAKELGSFWYGVEKNMCHILEIKRNLIDFSLTTQYDESTVWRVPFMAEYQVMNAALAITGMRILQGQGLVELDDKQMYEAIARTKWQGRMSEVMADVFLDGAHNVGGITEFLKNAELLEDTDDPAKTNVDKPILLFSMVKEKDYHQAIRLLAGKAWNQVFVTTIPSQRGIPAEELQQIFAEENNLAVVCIDDYRQAFETVMSKKKAGQKVFCTGSLYFIGALLEYIENKEDGE